jgi:DNA-binding transcriptional regulator YhcF (GntR family)
MAKRSPSLKVPAFALERFSGVALHRQLYLALRELILTGGLREGERLPSSRALAKGLKISRNTVVKAYERLAEKNLTAAMVGSGTHVAMTLPHVPDFGFLQHAFVRHAAPTPAGGTRGGFKPAAILRGSRYPLHRATFLDGDGNSLYLYDAHLS